MRLAQPSMRIPYATTVATLLLALSTASTRAADLDEVLVTAQKRSQPAQDVGIALSTLSAEQVRAMGKTDSVQIAALVPGVSISGSSGNQSAQFSIRGVTQNDFSDHVEAPNAVYIDEGYIGFSQGQMFGLFDLDHIEILKGPQGTLFGRNATGGLVDFITRKPSADPQGYADLTVGAFHQLRIEAATGGPLTDALNGRLSVLYNRHDPILRNDFAHAPQAGLVGSASGASGLWNDNQYALRGQLAFDLTEQSHLLVSLYTADKHISSANWQQVASTAVLTDTGAQYDAVLASGNPLGCHAIIGSTGACAGGLRPVTNGDFFGYRSPDPKALRVSEDYARLDSNRYGTNGLTATLTTALAGATLTAVTHVMHFTKRQAQDVDESPAPQLVAMTNSHNDTLSQEIRLAADNAHTRWVAGLYFLQLWTVYNQGLADEAGNGIGQFRIFGEALGTPSLEGAFVARLLTRSLSVFGQADIDLAPHWTLVTGARRIEERKRYDYTSGFYVNTNDSIVANAGASVGPFLPNYAAQTREPLWAGKTQLEYRPSADLLVYGGIHRGVKAGSFNAPLSAVLTPPQYAYRPEQLTSVESGFKATVLGGRARWSGSAYYYHYKDYQAFVLNDVSGAISNVDAHFKGLELQLQSTVTRDLSVSLSAAYIDATIPHYRLASGVTRDVEPAFTPRSKLVGSVRYVSPLALAQGELAVQFDATATSSFYENLQNYQSMRAGSALLENVRVSWRRARGDSHWELALFVHNLADVRNKTTGVDLSTLCGCSEQAYGDPRWIGLQLRIDH